MPPNKLREIAKSIREYYGPSGYRLEGITPRIARTLGKIEQQIYAQFYMPMHYMPFIFELSSQVPGKAPEEMFSLADQYEQDRITITEGETVSPGGIILGG